MKNAPSFTSTSNSKLNLIVFQKVGKKFKIKCNQIMSVNQEMLRTEDNNSDEKQ
jgi:hypothetical protein